MQLSVRTGRAPASCAAAARHAGLGGRRSARVRAACRSFANVPLQRVRLTRCVGATPAACTARAKRRATRLADCTRGDSNYAEHAGGAC